MATRAPRSRLPRAALTGALCLTLAGCAAATRAPTTLPRATHVERLYFGRNIGDSAVVSDTAWATFVRDALTPAFPDGATIWDAAGRWRTPEGALVCERSFVVEVVHVGTADEEARVQAVIDAYKRRFAQRSVLRVTTDARVDF